MNNKQKKENVDIQFVRNKQPQRKSKLVRVPFYNELQDTSELSGISMATLLNFAWDYYKGSKDYYNLIMKETM